MLAKLMELLAMVVGLRKVLISQVNEFLSFVLLRMKETVGSAQAIEIRGQYYQLCFLVLNHKWSWFVKRETQARLNGNLT